MCGGGQVLDVLMESESSGVKGQCRAGPRAQLDQLSPTSGTAPRLVCRTCRPFPWWRWDSRAGAAAMEGAGPEQKAGLTALGGSCCRSVRCFLTKKIATWLCPPFLSGLGLLQPSGPLDYPVLAAVCSLG